MAFHISNIRLDQCHSLQFSGIHILLDQCVPEKNVLFEVTLAKNIFINLKLSKLIGSDYIDHVFSVASLPRAQPCLLIHEALRDTNLNAGHIVELGNNCASILDALFLCFAVTKLGDSAIILCADAFQTTYKAKSLNSEWLDGASALVFGKGNWLLTIESYVTGNDPQYNTSCSFLDEGNKPFLNLSANSEFLENDIANEMTVCLEALALASLTWSDIHGYVVINRNQRRVHALEKILKPLGINLYQSREKFGHRGGTDLIKNMHAAMTENASSNEIRLLLVGNGLGYTWASMIVRIDRNLDA